MQMQLYVQYSIELKKKNCNLFCQTDNKTVPCKASSANKNRYLINLFILKIDNNPIF